MCPSKSAVAGSSSTTRMLGAAIASVMRSHGCRRRAANVRLVQLVGPRAELDGAGRGRELAREINAYRTAHGHRHRARAVERGEVRAAGDRRVTEAVRPLGA